MTDAILAIGCAVLGFFLYVATRDLLAEVKEHHWTPVVCIVVLLVAVGVAVGTILYDSGAL